MEQKWTDEQLATYECAVETVGNVIALKAAELSAERAKAEPDVETIQRLKNEQLALASERQGLRVSDLDANKGVIEKYGLQVKARR